MTAKQEQDLAYRFVQTMVSRADTLTQGRFPAWHGWALREAFLAGRKSAIEECAKIAEHANIWALPVTDVCRDEDDWKKEIRQRIAAAIMAAIQ